MVRNCITFAGTRVDQMVAIEVLEALRPLGVQAALDALDHSQNQTDKKRRSLELALQKARYEASRIERQYQATEPENRQVAAELEKRWNTFSSGCAKECLSLTCATDYSYLRAIMGSTRMARRAGM
jgi:hypothetical protein